MDVNIEGVMAVKIEWRFKRKTKVVHAFQECSGVSLCGLMLAGNGPITVGRTCRCVLCQVQVANLTGVPFGQAESERMESCQHQG